MIQSDLSMISFAYFFLSQFDYCFHAGNLVEFGNCTYGRVSEMNELQQSATFFQIFHAQY